MKKLNPRGPVCWGSLQEMFPERLQVTLGELRSGLCRNHSSDLAAVTSAFLLWRESTHRQATNISQFSSVNLPLKGKMGTTFLCSGLEKVNGIQKKRKNNTVKGSYQEQCFEEEKRNQDYRKEVDRRQKFTQRSGEQADALCGQGAGQQAREADKKSRTQTHQCTGQDKPQSLERPLLLLDPCTQNSPGLMWVISEHLLCA